MRARLLAVSLLLALVVVLALAAPAGAIIGGQKDVLNHYSNVCMVATQYPDGSWDFGSGTLVENDSGGIVVLTAAHVVADAAVGGLGLDALKVSFDVNASPPWAPRDQTYYAVTRVEIHPDYLTAPPAPMNSVLWLGPGHEDVALVWLKAAPPGIVPAHVVASLGLDALNPKTARFTVVGYGATDIIAGSGMSLGHNPNTSMLFDGRNYKQAQIIQNSWVYADRYLTMSAATAFGDSGGPTFFGTTVVADTVWGFGMNCASPYYPYRLDEARAQWFLTQYLPPDRFVALQ